MISNRIKVSSEATAKMTQLKVKLRVQPLYAIARLGFCLSLTDKRPPQEEFYREDGMEFNRITLLGDYDPIYISLLHEYGLYKKSTKGKKTSIVSNLGSKELTSLLIAHINRGVNMLYGKVKNQDDVFDLVQEYSR